MSILQMTVHRPYPMPQEPWVMQQTWGQLLFMHWPLSPSVLEPYIPDGVTLDTFDGDAWISVVPFYMSNIRPRFTVALPWLSYFAELNVRTYVTRDGRPGVLFFSLDASNPIGVWLARTWYQLPYFNAKMSLTRNADDSVTYYSQRRDARAPAGDFHATYCPTGPVYQTEPDTLDYFLTERYCLYTMKKSGQLMRGEIHHQQWPLQPAQADVITNTVSSFKLPDIEPVIQYVDRVDIYAWPIKPV